MHHGELEGQVFACPVKALSRQVAHIWVHTSDGTNILFAYWESIGRSNVTDRDMIFHMTFAAAKLGYPRGKILLDSIDTHSHWAGGACAIKTTGFDDKNIRKMVICLPSSNDFLEYIQ